MDEQLGDPTTSPDDVVATVEAGVRRSKARLVGTAVLLFVLVVFAGLALHDSWSSASDAFKRMSIIDVVLASLSGAGALWFMYVTWRALLEAAGGKLETHDARTTYFTTQIGKYVPGSVWPVVLQTEVGRRNGVARAVMLMGYALSFGVGVASGATVGLLALDGPSSKWVPIAALAGGIGGIALTAMVIDGRPLVRLMLWLARWRHWPTEPVEMMKTSSLQRSAARRGLAAIFGAWILLGLHAWFLARPLGAGVSDLPFITGSFAFAWVVGMVAVPIPAGAGVREVVLVLTVGELLGHPEATVVALTSRFLLVVLELGAAAIAGSPRVIRRLRRADVT